MRKHLLLALAVSAAASALAAPSALAHGCISHPSETSVVCVRDVNDGNGYNWHTRVDVCDRHADGHRVYARVGYFEGFTRYYMITGYDINDSASGCSTYAPSLGSPRFMAEPVAICVQSEGCSAWKTEVQLPSEPTPYPSSYSIPRVG